MARSLSQDLRSRVVAAVTGGLSRRAAAERFGISIASAVRWMDAWRRTGEVAAQRQGGDRRSERIEAFAPTILGALKAKVDTTLDELVALLARKHGERFARMYAAVENSATEAAPYWCCGRRKTRPVVRLVPLGIGQDVCRGSVRRRSPVRIFGWS